MRKLFLLFALFFSTTAFGEEPVNRPPKQWQAPQKIVPVASFSCQGSHCEIACYPGGNVRKFTNLSWAVVYKNPNSERLWLYAGGPNDQFLIDGIFCDFSKILKDWPLD
jgi:hypothetical protein